MRLSKCLILLVLVEVVILTSCKQDTLPKPNAMLALAYPEAGYKKFSPENCPYQLERNSITSIKTEKDCGVIIDYPTMNGALYLTYRNVNGDIDKLLADAQKLTYEHVVKADNIVEEKYVDAHNGVYGMFYDIGGNAASQSQFYLTDSTSHFITGAIYFNVRPNYDSIYPAADYLRKDIRHLMESFRWASQYAVISGQSQ